MRSTGRPNWERKSASDSAGIRLAALSGVLLGAAFLPAPLGFLAWIALVPLLWALDRALARGGPATPLRALFGLGLVFGFTFFLIGMHWIALLSDVAITVPWLKYPAWLLAAAYLGAFGGLTTLLTGWLSRPGRLPIAVTFPLSFLAIEELRASGELGFPWFQAGYTQHAYLPVIQMASLGSVTLVTLWLAFVNVLAWRSVSGGARARAALGALLLVLLPWFWGRRVLDVAPATPTTAPRVALVQGNIPSEMKWTGNHQPEILARFLSLSMQAARQTPRPALIIWPETATGSYLRKQLDQALAVAAFASGTGVPVFSGYADYAYDSSGMARHFNAAGLFEVNGALGESYGKRHLVPFGERMPFEQWFPALGKLELGQAEWTPGPNSVRFGAAGVDSFACLVCFESIFPDLAREDVRGGARWLVNITNDEWFGNSAALRQHAAMAVFRAVENHVPLARCANTGLTIMIDSRGRTVGRLPVFEAGTLVEPLPPADPHATPYTHLGDWPGLLAGIGVVACAMMRRPRVDSPRAR